MKGGRRVYKVNLGFQVGGGEQVLHAARYLVCFGAGRGGMKPGQER